MAEVPGCSWLQYSWQERRLPAEPRRVRDPRWPPPSCGVALQITACNSSAFEIIPVFLRIKLNPDHSSEPVYGSVPPARSCHRSWGGSKLWHGSACPRAGPPQTSSAAQTGDRDTRGIVVDERLAFVPSIFYLFHCLLVSFAWNHLTVFIKPKKGWKSGVCCYPHLQRTILCSSSK